MSGIGRTLADLELRNARAMSAGQSRWDNMAPPEWADADERTSSQPLGDAAIFVSYTIEDGAVNVCGAWVNAEFVEAGEFSPRRIEAWERYIRREIEDDAADHAECARLQAEMDREDAA